MMNAASRRPSVSENRSTFCGLELRVPPMPRTLMEALALMENSDSLDMAEVTDMVQRDPVVVARLLNIVNSAYYGLRHQITSAERAVVMLGPIAVAGIVVGMQMLKLRELVDGPAGACFNRLVRHSVATALIARHLADGDGRQQGSRRPRVGPAFTAGLLHDFGKIILVYNFPKKAVALYDEQALAGQIDDDAGIESEQLVFGYDHTEAGEYVARKLNFPDLLVEIVRNHHEDEMPSGKPEAERLLRAVAAANIAASAMGYPFTRQIQPEDLVAHPAWIRLVADMPGHVTAELLLKDVLALQPELDEYVATMTDASSDSAAFASQRIRSHTSRQWTRQQY